MTAPQLRRITEVEAGDPVKLARLLVPFLTGTSTAIGSLPPYVIRTVDVAMPSRWTTPTLAGTWTATTQVGFWKDSSGYVRLRGRLAAGTYSGTAIFTLPQTCWPASTVYLPAAQSSLMEPGGLVTVGTDGTVVAPEITSVQSGTSSYLSLDGLSFEAADLSPALPVYPFPFTFPFGVTGRPQSVLVLSCFDTTTSPQATPCPTVMWDIIQSGSTPVVRFLAFPGLAPSRRYRVRLLVCAT